ncbi:ethylene-responsive transcription factor RAP2-11 [Corchorus olitorius]|uniref:Ethylene-responsive transcription factor RAP2-11 n=1 Tax=Corchorus olitorius TaxID=93759 RepID=A0A1R3KK40_9ROSI|nr:ethylene-responsive transcription factor RAP2-11 [Corchorus olitorius]
MEIQFQQQNQQQQKLYQKSSNIPVISKGSKLKGKNKNNNKVSLDSPLASRIRNLLNSKKGAKQESVAVSSPTTSATSVSPSTPSSSISSSSCNSSGGLSTENSSSPIEMIQDTQFFDDAYKPDMSICTKGFEFASPHQSDFSYNSESAGFDRFLYTQEIMNMPKNVVLPEESGSDELTEFQRMKVERQISASLYAMNGVQEYMETVHDSSEALWDLPPLCSLFC